VARNFELVGHSNLGGKGFNADVWAHRGFAYVGVWAAGPPNCPANGVKVADVRDPRHPRLVSRLQNPGGTSAEDIVVRRVHTEHFRGDLAVTGIQACDPGSGVFRGLQFFDVTNPFRPRELSRWRVPAGTIGCHEVDLVARDGKVFAGCANLFAEQITGADEVNVVNVTDPRAPRKVAGFAIGRDLGVNPARNPDNVGCFPASFAHSVRFSGGGRTLFVSYWDFGLIRFDVGPGGGLRMVNRTDIAPPDEDGDVHSMTPAANGRLQIINPEDFSPVDCGDPYDGWGEAHVYTNTRGTNRFVTTFSTPNSRSSRTDGFYSIHNTEVVKGTQALSSWYSDGIVWWTVSEAGAAWMRGRFVPPATADPLGVLPTAPLVWGVFPDSSSDLVFASDMNSGLWIVRAKGLGDF
jgi:hypothetical protein